jgi:hypothetical protein
LKTHEFRAAGAVREVADAIEQLARAQGNVTALVVPWESTASMLNMAVTAVKSDGWAIEHTNLGTITLTAEGAATRVAVARAAVDSADKDGLTALFDRFALDVRRRLGAGDV